MKKLHVFMLLVVLISSVSYSQVYGQNTPIAVGLNTLNNYPNPFEEVTTVKFTLAEDCYVKLFVINVQTQKQTLLVDGEVAAGKQGIIFKAPPKTTDMSANYKCTLEVYTITGNKLLYISEIKMKQE